MNSEILPFKKLSFIGLGCWRFGEPEDNTETDNPGKSYWADRTEKTL